MLLKAEANAARLYLKLEELKEKRFSYKRKEIATIKKLKQLENTAGMLKKLLLLEPIARTTNSNFLDLDLLANLG